MRSCVFAVLLIAGCFSGISFDQAKWRNADITGRSFADMLPDFMKRYELEGMPRQQVVALLGPPTRTDKWQEADMIYLLGNDGSMFPIDNEWLLIKLDRRGRVEAFTRRTD